MTGAAVVKMPGIRIDSPNKQAGKRNSQRNSTDVAVRVRNNHFRINTGFPVHTEQPQQQRGPHSGSQSLPANVSQHKDSAVFDIFDGEEIAWHMPGSKCLAGDFKVTVSNKTWRA